MSRSTGPLQRTIKAVIRPGNESGYVAECVEIAVVTQGGNTGRGHRQPARGGQPASRRGKPRRAGTGSESYPGRHDGT